MFSQFQSFEEMVDQETPEAKENRLLFECEKKQELKQFITKVNKDIFEDILPIKKDYVICLKSCYNVRTPSDFSKSNIPKLEECKKDCKSLKKDIMTFFDNVEFLAEKKINKCMKKCNNFLEGSDDFFHKNVSINTCLWMCHSRLDNRYKGYWMKQKNQIIERHRNKTYEKFISEIENSV